MSRTLPASLLLLVLAALPAAAQPSPAPDKSAYTLFNPTPDALLRDFSTDRPGKTQNPITLDAGHVQVETDLVNYSYDHWSPSGVTSRQTLYGGPELKLGLTDRAEFDVVLPPYTTLTQHAAGTATTVAGFGDLQLGGKINIFGNSGGDRSLGLLALVKIPTAAAGLGNNMVEGTVMLPYVIALPHNFSSTLETAFGLLREAAKQGYAADTQFLVNLGHPIGSTVSAAVELALDYSTDHNTGTRDTIDATLQWQATKTLEFDAGINLGITKAAPDLNPYIGLGTRF